MLNESRRMQNSMKDDSKIQFIKNSHFIIQVFYVLSPAVKLKELSVKLILERCIQPLKEGYICSYRAVKMIRCSVIYL